MQRCGKNGEIPREQLVGAFFAAHPKILVNLDAAILSRTGHNFHTHSTSNEHGMLFLFFVFMCLAMMRQKDSKERCVEHSVLIFGLAIMCLERS